MAEESLAKEGTISLDEARTLAVDREAVFATALSSTVGPGNGSVLSDRADTSSGVVGGERIGV